MPPTESRISSRRGVLRQLPLLPLAALLTVSSLAHAGTSAATPSADSLAVTTVARVELERYAGLWYEVARIPNRFQKQCVRGTTATYTLRDDGRIAVLNQCVKDDGSRDQAKGVARIVDRTTNAKLEVSFLSILGWRPFWGDYWVIGLGKEYRWAVIGTPDRKYGWILARTPTLDDGTMQRIFAILERNGYEPSTFEMSPP